MNAHPAHLTLDQWHGRYDQLRENGLVERFYGGPLRRHFEAGDKRLGRLYFDNSAAGLALWNLVLTEEDRLGLWRFKGNKIVGTMKDLGTAPLLAYSFDNLAAFYPDAAWWIPCFKQHNDGLFALADPMIGASSERAERIAVDVEKLGAEAIVVCRIPGASHCAAETRVLADRLAERTHRPVLDIEIPTLIDPYETSVTTRLEALIETARNRRHL